MDHAPVRPARARTAPVRRKNAHRGPQGWSGGGTKLKTIPHTPKFSSTGALSCLLDWSAIAVGHVENMGRVRRLRGYEVLRYVQYDYRVPQRWPRRPVWPGWPHLAFPSRKTRCHRSIAPRRDGAAARLPTSTPSMSSTVKLLLLVARRHLNLLTAAGLLSRSRKGHPALAHPWRSATLLSSWTVEGYGGGRGKRLSLSP